MPRYSDGSTYASGRSRGSSDSGDSYDEPSSRAWRKSENHRRGRSSRCRPSDESAAAASRDDVTCSSAVLEAARQRERRAATPDFSAAMLGEEDAESVEDDAEGYEEEVEAAEAAEEEEEEEEEERADEKAEVAHKDVVIYELGPPGKLVVRETNCTMVPGGRYDVIVKVEASTVSYRDCLLRRGVGPDKVAFPFVPGCEVVGTISNLGRSARAEGYRVGERVAGMTRRGGGSGTYVRLRTTDVARFPSKQVDAADAVCLVDVYMTAYQALRAGKRDGAPLTGANVLVTDGHSPVGQAAVALARLEGANVYVTIEKSQMEYMQGLGAKCLPLAPSKWLDKLRGKMDLVVDTSCVDSYDSTWKAVNHHGTLVCTGMSSLFDLRIASETDMMGRDPRESQAKWAGFKARYMMSQTKFLDVREGFRSNPKKYQQELKYLCFLVESGRLEPNVAERVGVEEVGDMHRLLEKGDVNGTIVCLPN
ncbi:hypothetical protein ACHAWF_005577 [Thalassiosira exigua]